MEVTASQYNTTDLRNAMIDSVAMTAMLSATGNNCYKEYFEPKPHKLRRSFMDLVRRLSGSYEDSAPAPETICLASSFAGAQYLPEYWRQADDPKSEFMWIE